MQRSSSELETLVEQLQAEIMRLNKIVAPDVCVEEANVSKSRELEELEELNRWFVEELEQMQLDLDDSMEHTIWLEEQLLQARHEQGSVVELMTAVDHASHDINLLEARIKALDEENQALKVALEKAHAEQVLVQKAKMEGAAVLEITRQELWTASVRAEQLANELANARGKLSSE